MGFRYPLPLGRTMPGKASDHQGVAENVEIPGEHETLLDTFFAFLDESFVSSGSSSDDLKDYEDASDNDEDGHSSSAEKKREFWESQEQLLQATLCRTSSVESKIRQATKECLREVESDDSKCGCGKDSFRGCRNCLRREVCNRLLREGFDCAVCKSKWRSSAEIPPGEHTYLEVVDQENPKKAKVRVIIELNFRGEFEIAKASAEYNRLVGRLPEVFVGKAEKLRTLIKIICSASKRCMKEMNIHMGPWRKHKYMQAKWLGTCERPVSSPLLAALSGRRETKQRASMLTYDLVDRIPMIQCTAVEVV